MLASERRKFILLKLEELGSIRVNDIAQELGVSSETIRKDLTALEHEGQLRKEFGGAVTISSTGGMRSIELRSVLMQSEKDRIAQQALPLLPQKGIVYLDSGTTLLSLIKLIPYTPQVTFITNSFPAVAPLVSSRNLVYMLGGEFNDITQSTTGFWALQTISALSIDVAFLGNSGCASLYGPCVKHAAEAQLKQEIIQHSKKSIVMFDHSKHQTNAICQYTTWDKVDMIITDAPFESPLSENIPATTEVVIAK